MKKIDQLKRNYEETEIPSELEALVKETIQKEKTTQKKRPKHTHWLMGTVAVATLFISSINISPAMAQSMMNVPLLGSIVEVLTIQQVAVDEETYQADLETPEITGLENEELQTSLNKKYIEENKESFKQFEQEVANMKKAGGGHLGVDTGYEVMTNTEQLLSIGRYKVNTVGSSSTTMQYDTIDKQENILITLPSLFKDERYVDVISAYIYEEMQRQMAADSSVSYFTEKEFEGAFEGIDLNQNFYITEHNKLVISFDKYEITPGYMGIVTFEIPTEIVSNLLVSDVYIK